MTSIPKREYIPEPCRPFKVIHQHLSILNVNFKKKSLIGFTEIQVVSQEDDLCTIRLNSQQCIIHSIHINDYMCEFTYSEPTMDIMSSTDKKGPRKLDTFSTTHYEVVKTTDCDVGNGELIIKVPDLSDVKALILERKVFTIYIAYLLENPKGGLHFVTNPSKSAKDVDEAKEMVEDNFMPHMFTYAGSNLSRLWFPCVDSFSESCTWTIRITVDELYTAISSGELCEVEHNVQKKKKRFYYSLSVPTSAPNIGLVVGPFVPLVHPDMHEVVHFCFPTLKSLLLDTCSHTHRIFEYYEELVNARYPYSTYKQVFVDNLESNYASYATFTIFSINLLHTKHVIEQTYITRKVLAQAIAEQYFGCFISMQSTADAWLTRGIARFLAFDYYKKAFGNNEYRFHVKKAMKKVIQYEQNFRPIVLDPSHKRYEEKDYFYIKNFHTFSPLYDQMHRRKSFLIMRMLESYLGRELLLQVFNKMLSLAQIAITQKYDSNTWHNLYASTSSFIWAISTVTGKNIDTFLKQWVFQGGHVKLTGSFIFNRKRNTVELEIKQVHTTQTGVWRYLGPLMIWLQELDGTFKHTLQIEDNVSKHDITCHSKSRRNKKKKIPLCTGEEIDMDLTGMDQESPVLWLRIDPEMNLLREVILEQPDYQWQYQLRYERDIVAQLESLEVLPNYSSNAGTKNALMEILSNDNIFYRVRCEAAFCLRDVANKTCSTWVGPPAMLNLFRKLFGSPSCPQIVRMNNFTNFRHYFLQKSIVVAMAGLRTMHGICPHEVLRFLLDLFKYNDNSKNKYSDAYLRSAMVNALAETVTPVAITPIFNSSSISDILSQDTKNILEEITRYFNLDKLLPSYKNLVTVSCLRAIRHLQKMGHLPSNPQIFRCHTSNNCFIDVRKAAIDILVEIVKAEVRKEDLDFLLDLVLNDSSPVVKYYTLKQLIRNPPFTASSEDRNPLDTEDLVERLWILMNSYFSAQPKLRCAVIDLYFLLYGRGRPQCLPKPEFSFVLNFKDKIPDEEANKIPEQPQKLNVDEPVRTETVELVDSNKSTLASEVSKFEMVKQEPVEEDLLQEIVPMEIEEEVVVEPSSVNMTSELELSKPSTPQVIEPEEPKLSVVVKDEVMETMVNTPVSSERLEESVKSEDDDLDSSPDSDGDEAEEGEIRSPSPHALSTGIPTISIRMKGDPSADSASKTVCTIKGSESSSSEFAHSSKPPKKKKEKDRERKSEDGKERHKDKHKDKKKKKKKKNKKHKHRHEED